MVRQCISLRSLLKSWGMPWFSLTVWDLFTLKCKELVTADAFKDFWTVSPRVLSRCITPASTENPSIYRSRTLVKCLLFFSCAPRLLFFFLHPRSLLSKSWLHLTCLPPRVVKSTAATCRTLVNICYVWRSCVCSASWQVVVIIWGSYSAVKCTWRRCDRWILVDETIFAAYCS